MSSVFGFHKQNNIGKRGEELFRKLYPVWKSNNNGKNCKEPDFIDYRGRTLELKFDVSERAQRDSSGFQTNFFMETVSNNKKKTLGGVFRAEKEGVDFLVYMFEQPFRIFILDIQKTATLLRKLVSSGEYRKFSIKNQYYWTCGYALPIELFQTCLTSFNKRTKQERALKKIEWNLLK